MTSRFLAAIIFLAASTVVFAQSTNVFKPGGDLSGTWNNQTVVGVNAVAVPSTQPCVATNGLSQFIACSVTGTGSVALNTGAVFDCTFCTNVQALAIVGVLPDTAIPGSAVRYATATPVTIASTDAGNVVAYTYGAAGTASIAQSGSGGFPANAFQSLQCNQSQFPYIITPTTSTVNGTTTDQTPPGDCSLWFTDGVGNYLAWDAAGSGNHTVVGDTTIQSLNTNASPANVTQRIIFDDVSQQSNTNTEFTGFEQTFNGTHEQFCIQFYAGQGAGVVPAAGSGNCVIQIVRGASGANGIESSYFTFGTANASAAAYSYNFPGAAPAVFGGTVKVPELILLNAGSGCTASGQSCLWQGTANTVYVGSGAGSVQTTYAEWDGNGNLFQIADLIQEATPIAQGTPPVATCITNCSTYNGGVGVSLTFGSSGAASITTASSAWQPNEAVTLTAASFPTGFPAGTYYVNTTGISATTIQLCAAPLTWSKAVGYWTACTSLTVGVSAGTSVVGTGATNYATYGGKSRFLFQIPESPSGSAPTYQFTWPSDSNISYGWNCTGADVTPGTQLVQSAMTGTSVNMAKASAVTALDIWVFTCGAF